MRRIKRGVLLVFLATSLVFAQRTDLSGLKFCIDPGHGGHNAANDRLVIPNPGVEFWESESNFQKALLLDTLLQAQGAWVILTRYTNDYPNDNLEPSLSARVAVANANNVDWFHSIHSNAYNGTVNYTLMLVREQIVPGGDPVYGPGAGVPEWPEAWDMANIMGPKIKGMLRTSSTSTRLDYSFYGTYTLGVLRFLAMPGELSEGSFHDYLPETRRLLNNDYRKMEAYALRNSFMQYFGVPADTLGIIAGIQKEIGTNFPMNYAQVRLQPQNSTYLGDGYNNGFYMFDRVPPGQHELRFETPGYAADSATITVGTGATVFVDRTLESFAAPTVLSTLPVEGDTMYSAAAPIEIQFSKPMNRASAEQAFSITPPVAGSFLWYNTDSKMVFDPDTVLPFFVHFTVRLDTSARSAGGQIFDGNGDGIPGDPFVLTFRTADIDVFAPYLLAAYPGAYDTLISPTAVLSVTFNEPLNPNSVNLTNIAIQKIGGSVLPRTLKYWEVGRKSGVNVYLDSPFEPGASYRIRVSGVKDKFGNAIPTTAPLLWQFSVAPSLFQYTTIETFDTSLVNWLQPGASGSTIGVDSARFSFDTTHVPTLDPNSGSAKLVYSWESSAADWFIRDSLGGGAPYGVHWRKENTVLQVYVNGDGNGSQFRFAIDDSVDAFPDGREENREVSRWYTIDWVGWRFVEWDLEHDSVGSGTGNGVLEGDLRFDSFELRYLPGTTSLSGRLYFDQLQLATRVPVSVQEEQGRVPELFALEQNYPNPFNPSSDIRYQISELGHVRLVVYDLLGREVATLVNEVKHEGTYTVRFDASGLASGVYIYRLTSGGNSLSRKMLLAK